MNLTHLILTTSFAISTVLSAAKSDLKTFGIRTKDDLRGLNDEPQATGRPRPVAYMDDLTATATNLRGQEPGLLGGCSCAGGSISIWTTYETFPTSNPGNAGCIGGCGGIAFTMHDYMTSVRDLRIWWGHGAEYNGFKAIQVVFFNGKQQTQGVLPASGADASFTFNAGEFLDGVVTLSGNGHGTRTGYLHFKTNTGREFSAGNLHTPYYFEATGSLLAGFFGQAGSDIDQLGLLLFKPVKKLQITGVNYPTLDSYLSGLNPSSIVDRPYCNNGSVDQHEVRKVSVTTGSKEVWHLSMTESFEMTVSIEVTAGVPEVEQTKDSTSFKWGVSSTQDYSMEQDTTNTVEEDLQITYPANTKGEISFTQFDSKINVPWVGQERITFNDGSSMTMSVSGTYNGVYVSKITPVYDINPCNPCFCTTEDVIFGEDGGRKNVEEDDEKKGKKVRKNKKNKKVEKKKASGGQKNASKGGLSKEFLDMFSQALSPDVEG